VSLVEQERPTLSEHSGIFLRLQDLVFLIFEFSLSILENIVGLHFFGHTVLSFILQFTASVFPHCCLRDFWQSVYNLEEDMQMQIKFKLQMYTNSLMIPKMGKNRSCKLKNERQYSVAKKMKTNNVAVIKAIN
jgi:hypothetical protein